MSTLPQGKVYQTLHGNVIDWRRILEVRIRVDLVEYSAEFIREIHVVEDISIDLHLESPEVSIGIRGCIGVIEEGNECESEVPGDGQDEEDIQVDECLPKSRHTGRDSEKPPEEHEVVTILHYKCQ